MVESGAAVLISASDAADDGRDKLSRLGKEVFQCRAFKSAALSAAFGREGVKHAALLKGAAADRFRREMKRLSGFRAEAETIAQADSD